MQINRKLGSYPGLLITVSLTVALFLIGFCGWVAITSKELIRYVKQNIEVQVYLDKDLPKQTLDSIGAILKTKNYVDAKSADAIRFISRDEAAKLFFKETKENYQHILSENPFRDAFSLRIAENYFGESYLQEVQKDLEKIKGVYEADYAHDFVDGIAQNSNRVYIIMSGIVLIFLIATILLINNTIRLALYSQRFIIHTMQLVGATNAFIQKPFILRGAKQGLFAGLLAIILLVVMQQIAIWQINGFEVIQNYFGMILLIGLILILGVLLGIFSTYSSVVRYLRMDLDELV